MKKYIYFLFLLFPLFAFADVSFSRVIKAKFVLKNGTSFIGYYETQPNYGVDEKYQYDKGFQQLLAEEAKERQYKVTLFKSYYIEPSTKLGFVNEMEIVNLNLKDLKYTVFYKVLDVYYTLSDMKKVSNWFYNEIKRKQKTQYIKFENAESSESHVLSFNPNYNWKETCKMTRNLCEYLNNTIRESKTYDKKQIEKFESEIKELEKQLIFIFTFNTFTC